MSKDIIHERNKAIIAASFGMALEWYDFFIYMYVAPILSELFFPSTNPIASLMAYYLSFAVGFLGRPLGGLVFGYLGDKIGRRYALTITIMITGLSVFFIGLLPTYAQIGILASILISILRFLTGFALGGEWGGAFSLTSEYVNPKRRGFYAGVLQATVSIATLLATGLILLITSIMGYTGYKDFGWRILFIIGLFIAIVGLIIRLRIEETPVFRKLQGENKIEKNPISAAFRRYWKQIAYTAILVGIINGIFYYTNFAYATTYATTIAKAFHLPPASPITLTSAIFITAAVGLFLSILWGYLSDIIGRRTQIMINGILAIILAYPYFYLLLQRTVAAIYTAIFLGGSFIYYFAGAITPAFLVETYPPAVRYTGISFAYQIGVGLLGGFSPFILTLLVGATHNIFSPAYFIIAMGLIVLIIALFTKETKGRIYEGEEILKNI